MYLNLSEDASWELSNTTSDYVEANGDVLGQIPNVRFAFLLRKLEYSLDFLYFLLLLFAT